MSNAEYYQSVADLKRRIENVDATTLRLALVTFVDESATDVVRHLAARLRSQTLSEK